MGGETRSEGSIAKMYAPATASPVPTAGFDMGTGAQRSSPRRPSASEGGRLAGLSDWRSAASGRGAGTMPGIGGTRRARTPERAGVGVGVGVGVGEAGGDSSAKAVTAS